MRLPATAPTLEQLFERIDLNERLPKIFEAVASPTVDGEYPHWDDLRRRTPPEGLTVEEWWFGIKYARANLARAFPLQDPAGKPFDYCLTDETLSILHWIAQHGATVKADGRRVCSQCHDVKTYCDTCHQVKMPHPKDWIGKHSVTAARVGTDTCFNCHVVANCQACHAVHASGDPRAHKLLKGVPYLLPASASPSASPTALVGP